MGARDAAPPHVRCGVWESCVSGSADIFFKIISSISAITGDVLLGDACDAHGRQCCVVCGPRKIRISPKAHQGRPPARQGRLAPRYALNAYVYDKVYVI